MAKGGVTTSVSIRISPPEWTRVNMVGAPATGSAKAKARRAPCARSVLATAQHAAALEMGGHHSSYRYTSK